MEPPLGTFSFFLLCVQYCRDKRSEMGRAGTFAEYLISRQGNLLVKEYGSEYDHTILYKYGGSIAFMSDEETIEEEQAFIESRLKMIDAAKARQPYPADYVPANA